MNITRLSKTRIMALPPHRQPFRSVTRISSPQFHTNPLLLRTSPIVTRSYSTPPSGSSSSRNDNRSNKSRPSDVEVPVFDWKSLGLKGPVKIVVVAVICVLSTVETIFWCKVAWRWWNGEGEGEGVEDQKHMNGAESVK